MDEFIRLLKTLADPTRLRLLRLLAIEELTVGELAEISEMAQSRVSNHLRILRQDGLLTERREGAWHFYSLANPLPEPVLGLWPRLEAQWQQPDFAVDDLPRLKAVLQARQTHSLDYFERIASEWDTIRGEMFGDAIARSLLLALLPAAMIIADIGTGTGYVAELLGPVAAKVIAVDSSQSMLKMARVKAARLGLSNIEFRRGDALEPPLEPSSVDVVTFCMVLHHLEDPAAALAAAAPALKPGGSILVADFVEHRQQWLQRHMEHRWLGFRQSRFEKWLEDAGLESVAWTTLPGRSFQSASGQALQVPDAFLAVGRRPQSPSSTVQPRRRAAVGSAPTRGSAG